MTTENRVNNKNSYIFANFFIYRKQKLHTILYRMHASRLLLVYMYCLTVCDYQNINFFHLFFSLVSCHQVCRLSAVQLDSCFQTALLSEHQFWALAHDQVLTAVSTFLRSISGHLKSYFPDQSATCPKSRYFYRSENCSWRKVSTMCLFFSNLCFLKNQLKKKVCSFIDRKSPSAYISVL